MIRGAVVVVVGLIVALFLATPAGAIFNGFVDGSAHPFVGSVDIRTAGAPVVASGFLVSPTVFLTAGHVTAYFDRAGQTRARVTFDPVVSAASTWHWGTVHTNPAWTSPEKPGDADPQDLGVIVLDDPVAGITPASLPTENYLGQIGGQGHTSVDFEVVGYGTSFHVGDASNHGLESVAGDGTRKFAHAQFVTTNNGWVQVSFVDGAQCFGDSGGPLLLGNLAVGLTKGHANPEFCEGPSFNMRLDTPAHRAFIGQYVTLP